MPRVKAELPGGVRISDLMTVMVLARVFPTTRVKAILAETGKESIRERTLPATLMVYYVMALALYMQTSYQEILRCVFEAFNWFARLGKQAPIAAKSAIAQARERLGEAPLKRLYKEMVAPIATEKTTGAYHGGWLLVSLDGSTLDVGDTADNERAFGRPGVSRGDGSAFPKMRFCSLLENGTHVLFGAVPGPYAIGEVTLARDVITHLRAGMLCLADRIFFSYDLWVAASQTGADLLWRVKKNALLPCQRRLPDGSYLSVVYRSSKDRRHNRGGITVRVVEYRLSPGGEQDETIFRLITTILDHERLPAIELAGLYAERWEIENTLDEFKTHLRGRGIVLRSKTASGVYQEFWGFLLAHHAVRSIMHEAALRSEIDPDRLSYSHAVRVIRRKLPLFTITPPSGVAEAV